MNSNYRNRNNNLNPFDKGWFHVYKVILYIFFGLTILGTIALVGLSLYELVNSQGFSSTISFTFVLNLFFIRLLIWQLEAMEKRDLKVAKEALLGFTFYLCLNLFYLIGMSLAVYGTLNTTFALQYVIALAVFVVCILIGSVQVYLFLKKNKSDGYQNMNHVAP